MPVFAVVFLHPAVLSGIFRIFFHVVHRGIRDDPSRSHGVSYMLSEIHVTATNFPGTAVVSCEHELLRAIAFCQTTGHVPYIRFFLRKPKRASCENYAQNQFDFHSSSSQGETFSFLPALRWLKAQEAMYRGKKGLPSVARRNNSAFTINNFAFFPWLARSFVPMTMSAF